MRTRKRSWLISLTVRDLTTRDLRRVRGRDGDRSHEVRERESEREEIAVIVPADGSEDEMKDTDGTASPPRQVV